MRKQAKRILKSLFASPRSLRNPFQLSKISGEESDDLIGFSVVEGADDNGVRREERHKNFEKFVPFRSDRLDRQYR
jgi:hypothetical protein